MSRTTQPSSPTDAAHSYEAQDHDYSAEHGTLKGYLTGFVLSIILTAIPFWLVMGQVFSSTLLTVVLVLVLGVIQLYVHLVYFLHMDSATEGGWQLMALSFTLILLVIVLVGSIWVMAHLHANMMFTPITG